MLLYYKEPFCFPFLCTNNVHTAEAGLVELGCGYRRWPVYGFKAHKGYGTAAHIGALLNHGPCDIHRRSFAPLKGSNTLLR